MEYKGFEYSVVQTVNPTGWKWTVRLDETRAKIGSAFSRPSAINFAEHTIDKAAKNCASRKHWRQDTDGKTARKAVFYCSLS